MCGFGNAVSHPNTFCIFWQIPVEIYIVPGASGEPRLPQSSAGGIGSTQAPVAPAGTLPCPAGTLPSICPWKKEQSK